MHSPSPLRPTSLGLLLGAALALAACDRTPNPAAGSAGSTAPSAAALVVAADGVLCDLAQRLAAGDLRVDCLLGPSDDPHSFRLEPSQKALLSSAQLVLISGYGLTPALASLPDTMAVSERAVPQSVPLGEPAPDEDSTTPAHDHAHDHAHDGDGHDDEEGHDHGGLDPHVWHNPLQAGAMVGVIADRFVALAPATQAPIRQRAKAMRTVLEQVDRWNRAQFASLPAPLPPLASGHRAFASLAQAYGLRELPLVDGFSSSEALRPEAFRKVVERLRREQVPQLFAEQLPAPRTLRRISELSGVPIAPQPLAADALAAGPSGPLSLVATLTGNTCTIVTGWGGSCDTAAAANLERRWAAIQ